MQVRESTVTADRRRLRFVWNYLDWGGAQIHLLAIMKQAQSEWDIEALLPVGTSHDVIALIEGSGVRYRMIDACLDKGPATTLYRKLQRQWRRLRAEYVTYRELRRESLTGLVVHSELAPWQSWIFYWSLLRRGARVFVTMHNALPPQPGWRNFVWRTRLRFLSRQNGFQILPSNQHVRNSLEGWVENGFYERMPVTYTAVNPAEIAAARSGSFDRDEWHSRLGISPGASVVLTVGQFIDRKGRWVLLEAAREICKARSDVHFIWLTPELPEGEDLSRVRDHDLADRFHLVRSRDVGTTRSGVLSFFRIGDIFVLPSFIEGLPIALLEAMAIGLPSISTNVYGIPEAIIHNETGLLVEAGDPAGLCSAILKYIEDPKLREYVSQRGRAHVTKNFDETDAAKLAISEYVRLSSAR